MTFPLSISDVSLWIAVTTLLLLVTSELLLSKSGSLTLLIDKKRFQLIAIMLSGAFMVTVLIRLIMPDLF
jgi:hypothetical protein